VYLAPDWGDHIGISPKFLAPEQHIPAGFDAASFAQRRYDGFGGSEIVPCALGKQKETQNHSRYHASKRASH